MKFSSTITNMGAFARAEHRSFPRRELRRYRIVVDAHGRYWVGQYDDPLGRERSVGSNGSGPFNARQQEITIDAPSDEEALRIARQEADAYSKVRG